MTHVSKEPIVVGNGIVAQLENFTHTFTVPSTKEGWEKLFLEAITPTEEEIKAQQELRKHQAKNFQYFTQFKKEVIDMLTPTEQAYFYSAMDNCINGAGIVGSKHIEAIEKAEELSNKYGTSEEWMQDSAYGVALESFCKVTELI